MKIHNSIFALSSFLLFQTNLMASQKNTVTELKERFEQKIEEHRGTPPIIIRKKAVPQNSPLNDLPSDLKLQVMKQPGAAIVLYGVNKEFYKLAYYKEMTSVIQHTIPDSPTLHTLTSFLPRVRFLFPVSVAQLKKLTNLYSLDVSDLKMRALDLGKTEILALNRIPTLEEITLGDDNSYFLYSSTSPYSRSEEMKLQAYKLLLKEPQFEHRGGVASYLSQSQDQESKKAAVVVLRTLLQDKEDMYHGSAASLLLASQNKEDQQAATIVLRSNLDLGNPGNNPSNVVRSARILFNSADETNQELATRTLKTIVESENFILYSGSLQFEASSILIDSKKDDAHKAASTFLRKYMLGNISYVAAHLLAKSRDAWDQKVLADFKKKFPLAQWDE
jgi:hypothetical protein